MPELINGYKEIKRMFNEEPDAPEYIKYLFSMLDALKDSEEFIQAIENENDDWMDEKITKIFRELFQEVYKIVSKGQPRLRELCDMIGTLVVCTSWNVKNYDLQMGGYVWNRENHGILIRMTRSDKKVLYDAPEFVNVTIQIFNLFMFYEVENAINPTVFIDNYDGFRAKKSFYSRVYDRGESYLSNEYELPNSVINHVRNLQLSAFRTSKNIDNKVCRVSVETRKDRTPFCLGYSQSGYRTAVVWALRCDECEGSREKKIVEQYNDELEVIKLILKYLTGMLIDKEERLLNQLKGSIMTLDSIIEEYVTEPDYIAYAKKVRGKQDENG